jgi:hypothetical protein
MKKICLIIATLMAFHFVHASETFVGIKAGAVFSRFTSRDAGVRAVLKVDQKLYAGPTAGLDILFRLNNYIALQPEINFRMVANKYKSGSDYALERYMQVEVPIMVKGGYGKENYFVYASVGPYVAANAAGQYILKMNGDKEKDKIDFHDDGAGDGVQRVDVGICAGVGGMYIMKKGAIDLEFRFYEGLLGQYKNISPKKENVYWKSMAVSVAYVFKTLGK